MGILGKFLQNDPNHMTNGFNLSTTHLLEARWDFLITDFKSQHWM